MAEQIDLTTPDQTSSGTPLYWIAMTQMDRDAARVTLRLNSTVGLQRTFVFIGPDATSYMRAINRRNATVVSNEKWTLQLLVNSGYLNGTVSGAPD